MIIIYKEIENLFSEKYRSLEHVELQNLIVLELKEREIKSK